MKPKKKTKFPATRGGTIARTDAEKKRMRQGLPPAQKAPGVEIVGGHSSDPKRPTIMSIHPDQNKR